MAWASRKRVAVRSPGAREATSVQRGFIRDKAQKRLTAVGRVAAMIRSVSSIFFLNSSGSVTFSSSWAPSAIPKAAEIPMAGAPRTTISLMASAISLWVRQLTMTSRDGRSR